MKIIEKNIIKTIILEKINNDIINSYLNIDYKENYKKLKSQLHYAKNFCDLFYSNKYINDIYNTTYKIIENEFINNKEIIKKLLIKIGIKKEYINNFISIMFNKNIDLLNIEDTKKYFKTYPFYNWIKNNPSIRKLIIKNINNEINALNNKIKSHILNINKTIKLYKCITNKINNATNININIIKLLLANGLMINSKDKLYIRKYIYQNIHSIIEINLKIEFFKFIKTILNPLYYI